jgi:hypothetical protein
VDFVGVPTVFDMTVGNESFVGHLPPAPYCSFVSNAKLTPAGLVITECRDEK